jgi:hypothetical protein
LIYRVDDEGARHFYSPESREIQDYVGSLLADRGEVCAFHYHVERLCENLESRKISLRLRNSTIFPCLACTFVEAGNLRNRVASHAEFFSFCLERPASAGVLRFSSRHFLFVYKQTDEARVEIFLGCIVYVDLHNALAWR